MTCLPAEPRKLVFYRWFFVILYALLEHSPATCRRWGFPCSPPCRALSLSLPGRAEEPARPNWGFTPLPPVLRVTVCLAVDRATAARTRGVAGMTPSVHIFPGGLGGTSRPLVSGTFCTIGGSNVMGVRLPAGAGGASPGLWDGLQGHCAPPPTCSIAGPLTALSMTGQADLRPVQGAASSRTPKVIFLLDIYFFTLVRLLKAGSLLEPLAASHPPRGVPDPDSNSPKQTPFRKRSSSL